MSVGPGLGVDGLPLPPPAAGLRVEVPLPRKEPLPVTCPCCGDSRSSLSHIEEVRFQDFKYRYLRCDGCKSLYADPMPSPSLLAEIYAPAYVEQHYAAELENESSSADLERELGRALELARIHRPGARLLDIGCGAGRFVRAATEAGFAVEGHEVTAGAASVAAERTGVRVYTGPLYRIRARYDVIHMADVLEHAPAPRVLLREAMTLLAEGGALLLRGPLENQRNLFQAITVWRRQARTRLLGGLPVEMPPYHVNLFTLDGWRALLQGAGLNTLTEEVTEVHWPAPEKFKASPTWAVKAASLVVSRSPIGKRFSLGNRVIGLFGPPRSETP